MSHTVNRVMVPIPDAPLEEIFDFAQTYNGYKHHVAQDIVKAEAEDLADFTASGLRRFSPNPAADATTGVLSGGLLSNEFYRRAFDNQVSMRLRSKEANLPTIRWLQMKSGLEAAVLLAAEIAAEPR